MTRVPWLYLLVSFLVSNSVIARQQVENHDDGGVVTKADEVISKQDDALDDLMLPADTDTIGFDKTRTDVVTENGATIGEANILPVTDNNQTKPKNRPESSERPKKSEIGEDIGARTNKGIEQGPVNRFPSLIPSLEYLDPKLSYELPDLFKFGFVQEDKAYFILVTKEKIEVIHPLSTLKLIGQQALWNLNKEDVIEFFTGRDISDDSLLENFRGWVVTRLINGFHKRLVLFTYSIGDKSFVIEPSIIYLVDSLKHLRGKDLEVTDFLNLNGISHFIFHVTPDVIMCWEERVMQINMFMTGDQSMINNSLQLEQSRSSLTASDKVRYYMLSVAKKTVESFRRIRAEKSILSVNILGTALVETSEEADFIESSLIGPNIINGSAVVERFKNMSIPSEDFTRAGKDVLVYMTRYNIDVAGNLVNGISFSAELCSPGIIIVKDEEFYRSSNVLSKHAGLLLGLHYDGDGNECLESDGFIMSAGTYSLTQEHLDNSELFSKCAGEYLEKSFEEILSSNQKCFGSLIAEEEVYTPYGAKYPGEVFDLDAQCQLTFGKGYNFQWPKLTDDVCKMLNCRNIFTNQLRSKPLMRAFEGTSCRSGAWCKKNVCANDKRAPMILERGEDTSDGQSSDQNFVVVVTLCATCVVVSVLSLGFLIFLACWTRRKVEKFNGLVLTLAASNDGKSELSVDGSNEVE